MNKKCILIADDSKLDRAIIGVMPEDPYEMIEARGKLRFTGQAIGLGLSENGKSILCRILPSEKRKGGALNDTGKSLCGIEFEF